MNVFGAFTFGSLIKTFLPGSVWLIALVLIADDVASVTSAMPNLAAMQWLSTQVSNILVLAFPAAILLGLLSNILVFMGLNDWLVRNPVKKANKDFESLYTKLCYDMVTQRLKLLGWDSNVEDTFREHADVEFFALQALGVPNLAYVREQYWYHLEFQVNLFFASLGLLFAVLASPHIYKLPAFEAVSRALLCATILGLICWMLLRAAKKNYLRHRAKMFSVLVALHCAEKEKSADAAKGKRPEHPGAFVWLSTPARLQRLPRL